MTLKSFFSIMICLVLLISCRDKESPGDGDTLNMEENEFSRIDRDIPQNGNDEEDNINMDDPDTTDQSSTSTTSREDDVKKNTSTRQTTVSTLTGQYIKIGNENDSDCGCYCLDLSGGNTELCLIEGEMFIDTRMQKNPDNSIDVFLMNPSARNIQGKDIPWKDFDRSSAIATIKPTSNGELELDWLGFKINGDIAVDYAILGKKTLEGKYKKK